MGNSASSLPYSIGKQVSILNDGWVLHEGQRKSDGTAVSVFVAKKPSLGKTPANKQQSPHFMQLEPALHHFQYCRKLRHPHILSVHATLDTDNPSESSGASGAEFKSSSHAASSSSSSTKNGDLIIVTEPCISLDAWLQTEPPPEQLAWGLEASIRALHFLHASANLAHGNVSPACLFVTKAGDVKLWNFALVTNVQTASGGLNRHFIDYESLVAPNPYRSPERVEKNYQLVAANGTHAMDSFSVGVLIGHFYGGHVPGPLVKAVQRLQTPNLKMRPRLQPLLKCPVFDTPHQKLQLQLEEFAVQPVEAKIAFWQNLTPTLKAGLVPEPLAVYKLLPLIKTTIQTICSSDTIRAQDMYRREVLSMLSPMFYIAETFVVDGFAKELSSTIAMLFAVNDRGVRGLLLKKASVMAERLDKNFINTDVFGPMCSGFSDSSAALRELTLKATLVLVPHLSQPNLEKLSRYLVRLQGDQEAAIRTNTVIFFSRLAPHLTEMSRQKLLLPAFMRAMKDPFTPCRLAALQSTLKAKEFFDPAGIASKVLPAVTPCLIDASPDVRKEAFSAVEDLLFVLRQESERLGHLPQQGVGAPGGAAAATGAPVAPPAPAAAAPAPVPQAPSSGGYFSSWMSSSHSSTANQAAPPQQQQPRQQQAPQMGVPTASSSAPIQGMAGLGLNAASGLSADADDWGDDDDGWGDDDGDLLDISSEGVKSSSVPAAAATTTSTASNLFAPAPVAAAANDDFFGAAFETKPVRSASMTKKNTGAKLAVPAKKTKTAVKKLAVDNDVDDGWDDF